MSKLLLTMVSQDELTCLSYDKPEEDPDTLRPNLLTEQKQPRADRLKVTEHSGCAGPNLGPSSLAANSEVDAELILST